MKRCDADRLADLMIHLAMFELAERQIDVLYPREGLSENGVAWRAVRLVIEKQREALEAEAGSLLPSGFFKWKPLFPIGLHG